MLYSFSRKLKPETKTNKFLQSVISLSRSKIRQNPHMHIEIAACARPSMPICHCVKANFNQQTKSNLFAFQEKGDARDFIISFKTLVLYTFPQVPLNVNFLLKIFQNFDFFFVKIFNFIFIFNVDFGLQLPYWLQNDNVF